MKWILFIAGMYLLIGLVIAQDYDERQMKKHVPYGYAPSEEPLWFIRLRHYLTIMVWWAELMVKGWRSRRQQPIDERRQG